MRLYISEDEMFIVPSYIAEAIDIIFQMVVQDESLDERTTLLPDRIADPLESAYTQLTWIVTMNKWMEGSPVKAIIADLYMQFSRN